MNPSVVPYSVGTGTGGRGAETRCCDADMCAPGCATGLGGGRLFFFCCALADRMATMFTPPPGAPEPQSTSMWLASDRKKKKIQRGG